MNGRKTDKGELEEGRERRNRGMDRGLERKAMWMDGELSRERRDEKQVKKEGGGGVWIGRRGIEGLKDAEEG